MSWRVSALVYDTVCFEVRVNKLPKIAFIGWIDPQTKVEKVKQLKKKYEERK